MRAPPPADFEVREGVLLVAFVLCGLSGAIVGGLLVALLWWLT